MKRKLLINNISFVYKSALVFVLLVVSLFTLAFYAIGKQQKVNAYNLLSWDLVDSGKHLDWDGSCSYMTQWYEGVKTWNAYKPGVIRVDTFWIIQDVKISDYYEASGVAAVTNSIGTIKFNKHIMDILTDDQKLNVVIHEIGHALGIEHNYDQTSVLYPYVTSVTKLNADDKAAYDALYKRY